MQKTEKCSKIRIVPANSEELQSYLEEGVYTTEDEKKYTLIQIEPAVGENYLVEVRVHDPSKKISYPSNINMWN